jgi:hypothetical protein
LEGFALPLICPLLLTASVVPSLLAVFLLFYYQILVKSTSIRFPVTSYFILVLLSNESLNIMYYTTRDIQVVSCKMD